MKDGEHIKPNSDGIQEAIMEDPHSYFVIDNNDGKGPFEAKLHDPSAEWALAIGATLISYHGRDETLELPAYIETIGEGAFRGNTSLKSVDIGWRAIHIEPEAFMGCISLQTVVVKGGSQTFDIDGYYVTLPMNPLTSIGDRAFKGCRSLKNVEFEGQESGDGNTCFDVLNIGEEAFAECTSLEMMDLEYVAAWLSIGRRAFAGCTSLQIIGLSDALDKLEDDVFEGCTSLALLELPEAFRGNEKETAPVEEALRLLKKAHPNLQFELYGTTSLWESYDDHAVAFSPGWTMRRFRIKREVIVYRDFAAWWKGRPAMGLFRGFSNLSRVDLTGLDTSHDKSLACLFKGCTFLESVDLSCLDTSQVTDMRQMFFGCSDKLEALDLSCLDTSQVTTMAHLCHNCNSLGRIDLTGLDFSQVRSLWSAFDGCGQLEELDLSELQLPSLEKVGYMFRNCRRLERVNLRGFDFSQVKNLSHLFCGCERLRETNLAGADLHSVTSLASAFEGCASLTELDLSGLEGACTTKMDSCFKGCSSLTELDLSGLTVDVRAMHSGTYNWFQGCLSLTSLKLPKVIKSDGPRHFEGLFEGCDALERWSAPASWPVDNLDTIPMPTADSGMWWSERKRAWMTRDQIIRRGSVKDTYTSKPLDA